MRAKNYGQTTLDLAAAPTLPEPRPVSEAQMDATPAAKRQLPVVRIDYTTHSEELSKEDVLFLMSALHHYSRVPYLSTRARCIAFIRRLGGAR